MIHKTSAVPCRQLPLASSAARHRLDTDPALHDTGLTSALPQVLRLAGNYVDRMHGRLVRVSWQDQSDRIQSITVQWEPSQAGQEPPGSQLAVVEELCIHIYKQRKKLNLASERQGHRPFVSVGKAIG